MKILDPSISILVSIEKMLGIIHNPEPDEDDPGFDLDILSHINSSIAILNQLGVGPKDGFYVSGDEETFHDFLGDAPKNVYGMVQTYLYYRVKLGFDSASNSGVTTESLNALIAELEWRLKEQCDKSDPFNQEEKEEKPDGDDNGDYNSSD